MTILAHQQKLDWMLQFAAANNVTLELKGECGFGRDCVGISKDGKYTDYKWYDDNYRQIDTNGEVWSPPDAYHKHPCVAVLGRGEEAEDQLYQWLKWFEDNNFTVAMGEIPMSRENAVQLMFFGSTYARMSKNPTSKVGGQA